MAVSTIRAAVVASAAVAIAGWFGWFIGATRQGLPPVGPTPPSCVRALDLASEGFTAASDAIDALYQGDKQAADRANERLEDVAPDAGEANRACRRGE